MAEVRLRALASTAGWTAWLGAISAIRRASFRSWFRSAAGELKDGLGGGVQVGAFSVGGGFSVPAGPSVVTGFSVLTGSPYPTPGGWVPPPRSSPPPPRWL